ncbi:DUF6282 family protein [Chloroflexota bacterium]
MTNRDIAKSLLKGAIDLHVHTSPDIFPRKYSDIKAAQKAKAAGLKAIVLRNHFEATAGRARIASEQTHFTVFGSILLEYPLGGLNLFAVDAALSMGAKIVCMPNIHAAHFLANFNPKSLLPLIPPVKGLYLLRENGELKPEVKAILSAISSAQTVLDLGYVSKEECSALIREATTLGITKIILSNPLAAFVSMSLNDVEELMSLGKVFIEHSAIHMTSIAPNPISATTFAEAIRLLGPERSILTSDGGQEANPPPEEMFLQFIHNLLEEGITEEQIKVMVRDNPSQLLELSYPSSRIGNIKSLWPSLVGFDNPVNATEWNTS